MYKTSLCLVSFCLLLAFSACSSSPPATNNNSGASAAEAQAAAQAALDRMDGRQPSSGSAAGQSAAPAAAPNASSPGQSAPSTQQTVVNTGRAQPAWVNSVDAVYGRAQYVAAVGYASDRAMAERNALANLIAIFGQSIRADQTIVNTYQEAVRNGVTAGWTDTIAMNNTIQISASMDTLIGAEIKEVWFDSKSTHYAVAVMEKAKTAQLYTDMIKVNQNMIGNLITMSPAEKNTIEGFTRYQFAGAVADINIGYGNLLKVIGAAPPDGMKPGDDYRLEAQNIAKTIPVGIRVKNDKSGRIQGAFAKALSDLGFRSGGTNARYILDVNITASPVDLPNNPNKFVRIELGANFTDAGTVLLPYNFNSREGHTTVSEAENRAYLAAERKIAEEYKNTLSNYLSQILPQR